MRYFFALVGMALASTAAAQPPQYPIPPQYPPIVPTDAYSPPKVAPADPFADAYAEALDAGKPLVVFVGVPARPVEGCVTVSLPELNGRAEPRVVVSRLNGTTYTPMHRNASDAEIRRALSLEVRPLANPFPGSSRPGEVPTADGDGWGRGPWPTSLPFPDGAVRYKPAKFTQAIYRLNDVPTIDRVPRSLLKAEWQVPGGMEGVEGWRSDLYRYVPAGWQRSWRALLPVVNSFGSVQHELGFTRSYPDGTFFVDALSNAKGEPFEIRMREKHNGKWESYVAWRNVAARPAGYHGLTRSCASCHNYTNGPGTGGYGVGLIPGGDTVFSDPFDALEQQ